MFNKKITVDSFKHTFKHTFHSFITNNIEYEWVFRHFMYYMYKLLIIKIRNKYKNKFYGL